MTWQVKVYLGTIVFLLASLFVAGIGCLLLHMQLAHVETLGPAKLPPLRNFVQAVTLLIGAAAMGISFCLWNVLRGLRSESEKPVQEAQSE